MLNEWLVDVQESFRIVNIIKSVQRVLFCVTPSIPSSLPEVYFENVDFETASQKLQCIMNDI